MPILAPRPARSSLPSWTKTAYDAACLHEYEHTPDIPSLEVREGGLSTIELSRWKSWLPCSLCIRYMQALSNMSGRSHRDYACWLFRIDEYRLCEPSASVGQDDKYRCSKFPITVLMFVVKRILVVVQDLGPCLCISSAYSPSYILVPATCYSPLPGYSSRYKPVQVRIICIFKANLSFGPSYPTCSLHIYTLPSHRNLPYFLKLLAYQDADRQRPRKHHCWQGEIAAPELLVWYANSHAVTGWQGLHHHSPAQRRGHLYALIHAFHARPSF